VDDSERLRISFSAALKRRRTSANLSQADLAAGAGLEQSYISLLERGVRIPGLDAFLRLSRALGVSPTRFLSEIQKAIEKMDTES
jgi:transcriptional regulator with XRE-family HTH domain